MENFSDELQYSPVVSNHSTLIYRSVAPQAGSSATLSATSSVGPVEIIIPPSVWNPAKSRLNFTISIPGSGGTNTYNWISANLLQTLSRVVFYDSATNAVLMDVGNFDKYAAMVVPASTHIDTFLSKAYSSAQATAQSTAATAASCPVEDIAKMVSGTANYQGVANNNLYAENNQLGRRQVYISAVDPAAGIFNVSLPFEAFKHTFLSINKNVYFPSNTVLQIYFNAANQFVAYGTSATNLNTGNGVYAGAPAVTNIALSLANEANLSIVSQVIDKVMKEGLSLPIAYPTVTRQASSAGATSHAYSLQLTRGYGARILAVITAPFSTVDSNTNVHRRSSAIGTDIITQYNTFINNVPLLTPAGFDCTKGQDFTIANRCYLDKSVVQTLGEYILAEWLHVDGFCGCKPLWKYDEDQSHIDGLDVGAQSSTWSIQATTTALTCNWITAIIGQKMLTISNQGAMVM